MELDPAFRAGRVEHVALAVGNLDGANIEEEVITALEATGWDASAAARHIKLDRLLRLGLASRLQCENALQRTNWNLEMAASSLLEDVKS
ncbi:hypothetical protein J437_LFUL016683 [Ladona fulva]|uniref:UBA domain-containing protein n=1 Tax=Ladona fulva TaxID=123851 RepID=A0A8K0P9K1_LADFU|nr:hypothetical protein J437_LFUL016683 [Ladona fulva]